jgi:hypothetical protein
MRKISTAHPLQVNHEHTGPLPGSVGVERKAWSARATLTSDTVVVSVTANNPRRALDEIVASENPLDRWFKDEVRTLTGVGIAALFGSLLERPGAGPATPPA